VNDPGDEIDRVLAEVVAVLVEREREVCRRPTCERLG